MGERPEAKVFAKRERYKKRFYHASSPKSVAQVIHAFRKSSGHTTYVQPMKLSIGSVAGILLRQFSESPYMDEQ